MNFGGSKPNTAYRDELAAQQAKAAREKEEIEQKRRDEESKRRRGLRGVRQLFSGAGGFTGFPQGKQTLGE